MQNYMTMGVCTLFSPGESKIPRKYTSQKTSMNIFWKSFKIFGHKNNEHWFRGYPWHRCVIFRIWFTCKWQKIPNSSKWHAAFSSSSEMTNWGRTIISEFQKVGRSKGWRRRNPSLFEDISLPEVMYTTLLLTSHWLALLMAPSSYRGGF